MDTAEELTHRFQLNGHSNNGHGEAMSQELAVEVQPAVIEAPASQHRVRRWLGKAALVGAAFVSASTLGTMLHGSTTSIAGQSVNTRPTFDDRLTIHTGLTGSISIPMENLTDQLHGLGADVHVSDGQDANETDFAGIVSLFANADPDVQNTWQETRNWAILYGLGGALGLYAISKTKLINPQYRERLVQGLGSEHKMRVVLAATMLAGAAIPATYQSLQAEPHPNVSQIFDGSFLEGATATGWMNTLINDVGVQVVDQVESINTFSDQASTAVRQAFANEPQPFKTEGVTTVVSFEGLKCNPAMMPVIGEVIRSSHASFAIDAGDDVVGQENLDYLCLYQLVSQTDGTKILVAPGNHRTDKTIEQAKAAGMTVLEPGHIYEEHGLTVMGAPDPYPDASLEQEQYGPGHPERPALGRQIAEAAHEYQTKEHKQVSIAVLNQPGAATPVAESGAVNSVITGGLDSEVRSLQNNKSETTFTFESSAGGVINLPDFDELSWAQPPLAPANVYVDGYDPQTGKKLWSKIVTIDPTGDKPVATISPPSLTSFAATTAGQKILFGS